MAAPDLDVKVEGLDDLRRALRKAGDKVTGKALGQAGKSAADIVAQAARPKVPVKTGRAASTLRAVVANGGGAVAFGGPRAPYAGFLDYGNKVGSGRGVGRNDSQPREFRRAGRIVYPTLADKRDDVVATYEELVDDALRAAGLR